MPADISGRIIKLEAALQGGMGRGMEWMQKPERARKGAIRRPGHAAALF